MVLELIPAGLAALAVLAAAPDAGRAVNLEIAIEKTVDGLVQAATTTASVDLAPTAFSGVSLENTPSDDFYWFQGAVTAETGDDYRLSVTIYAPGGDACTPAAAPVMVFNATKPATIAAKLDGFSYRIAVTPAE